MIDKPFFELGAKEGKGIPPIIKGPYAGLALLATPASRDNLSAGNNQFVSLNFTGPPGSCSGLYYSLVFHLPKLGFHVVKVDEWISVSPEHVEYSNLVTEQKRRLEETIKAGLTSAARAVADYELLAHDLRKYREFLSYFRKKDEMALRSIFIDQVDSHTDLPNMPVALRSIVSRWPTIISDFMKLDDTDTDPDKIARKLNVSRAEAVILATKNRLYLEWKKMFKEAATERYSRLKALAESRKKTIDEYRNWLKPYITRFKMMKSGEEVPGVMKSVFKSYFDVAGQATFTNYIKLWAWQPFRVPEPRKLPVEKTGKFVHPPNDSFVVNKFIKDPKTGLARIYPWLLNEKNGRTVADEIIDEVLDSWEALGCDPNELYYVFMEIDVERAGLRLQVGEVEDITFHIRTYLMSQNILLVKLVELTCREREMERYIDEILGIQAGMDPEEVVKRDFPEMEEKPKKEPGILDDLRAFAKSVSGVKNALASVFSLERRIRAPVLFFKKGIYERDFEDRVTKFYLAPIGKNYFGAVKSFLIREMGVR